MIKQKNIFLYWKIGSISLSIFSLFLFLMLGAHKSENTQESTQGVVFVLDVSQSMLVQDVLEGKSRLDAAKKRIQETILRYPYSEYALSIFAWESLRVLPFTSDSSIFTTFLLWVNQDNIRKQGTRIDLALDDALENFIDDTTGTIVLLTDGDEDEIPVSKTLRQQLQEKELDLIVVWVGSSQGWYIPTGDIFSPYKLYQGAPIRPKLNTQELQNLARELGGTYQEIDKEISLQDSNSKNSKSQSLFLFFSFFFWIGFLWLYYFELYKK